MKRNKAEYEGQVAGGGVLQNYFQGPKSPLCSIYSSLPTPTPPLASTISSLHSFAFSGVPYSWNETV